MPLRVFREAYVYLVFVGAVGSVWFAAWAHKAEAITREGRWSFPALTQDELTFIRSPRAMRHRHGLLPLPEATAEAGDGDL